MRFSFSTEEPAEDSMSWADETRELPRAFEMPAERPGISFRTRDEEAGDRRDARRRRSAYGRGENSGSTRKRLAIGGVALAVALVVGVTGWTISADRTAMAASDAAARTVAAQTVKATKSKKHKHKKTRKTSAVATKAASNG
jgi:hypothetical protein